MKTLTTLSIAITLGLGISTNAFAYKQFSPERQQAMIDKIMQRFDTNKDNLITLDEVQAMRDAVFTKADMNGDGFLSPEEFAITSEEQRQTHLKEMFNNLDANKDGQLSLDELLQQPFGNPERKKAYFSKIDTNQNGVVSFEEFQQGKLGKEKHFMKHLYGMKEKCHDTQSCLQARFNMLDADKNGQLSRIEFVHNLPLFTKFDANSDGVITREEIAQQLQNKMQHRGRGNYQMNMQ
jgi:Ca2+-binding EF-hand superfamily protein